MKNRKWLNYTIGILLTLVVLTAVAGAGFRVGMMQNASFARPAFTHNFDGDPQAMRGNSQNDGVRQPAAGNSQNNDAPQAMQGNSRDSGSMQGNSRDRGSMQGNSQTQGFDNRTNDRRDGGISFLSPIFGLIRLVVLGLLLWIGYKFVKKSGWTISRVQASPAPVATPTATEVPSAEVEEEKPSE